MSSTIAHIAAWVDGLQIEHIPERILAIARRQKLSVMASQYAACSDAQARAVIAVAESWPEGPCRVGPVKRTLHPHHAVAVASALSMVYDFDSYLLVGHPCHSSVTVTTALGQALGLPEEAVLLAQIAANEVAGRLGFSCVIGPQNGQQLPFIHQVGAAVAAGKLLGLSADALANALGIALAQPPAPLWPAFLGHVGSKILVASSPAVAGMQAAEFAQAGLSGATDLLDHPQGFYQRFAFLPLPQLLSGFGRCWVTDSLHLKPYPACAYHQGVFSALEKVLALANDAGDPLDLANTQRVEVETMLLAVAVSNIAESRRGTTVVANDVNFSIPLGVAVFLAGAEGLSTEHVDGAWLAAHEPEIQRWADRVVVVHNADFTGRLLSSLDERLDLSALVGDLSSRQLAEALPRWFGAFPSTGAFTLNSLDHALNAVGGVMSLLQGWLNRKRDADYDLGRYTLDGYRLPFMTRVTAVNTNGDEISVTEIHAPGAAADLTSSGELVAEKFRRAAAGHLDSGQIAATIEDVLGTTL